MADADGALDALVAIAVGVVALAFPFVASGYHIYQGAQVLILAVALLGLNLLTGFNGQISLGHGAFFAIGGYGAAILMTKFGLPYWAAIPLASVVCFIAGFLFGFPALRFGGLYLALATFALAVATPQILSYKGFDALYRRLAGPHAHEAARAIRAASQRRPVALPRLPRLSAAALYWAARNLVRGRIGRALIAIRDQPIAAETMGDQRGALQDHVLRRQRALCRRGRGLERDRGRLRLAGELRACRSRSPFWSASSSAGLASLGGALFGALFIEFVPNIADQLTVSFGESAKALPGAIYGVLLILVMAAMPTGVAGAARAAARALARGLALAERRKLKTTAASNAAAKLRRKGRSRHDQSTHISAIERRRRGLRRERRFGPRRQRARRHRHRDQDRADDAL